MSLTTTDLDDIRNIVESALIKQNSEIIKPLQGKLESLMMLKKYMRCLLVLKRTQ